MIDPVALSTYSPAQVQNSNAAPAAQAVTPAQQGDDTGALNSLVSSQAVNPREAINPSIFQNTLNQAHEGLLSQLRSQTLSTATQRNSLGRTSLFDLFRSPLVSQQSPVSQFNAVSEPSTRRSLLDVTA
jgi:hypothetical protein